MSGSSDRVTMFGLPTRHAARPVSLAVAVALVAAACSDTGPGDDEAIDGQTLPSTLPTTLQFEPDDGTTGSGTTGSTGGSTSTDGSGTAGSTDSTGTTDGGQSMDTLPRYGEDDDEVTVELAPPTPYYSTLPPGSGLPGGDVCAEQIVANRWVEHRPDNATANATTAENVAVDIDGAEETWNAELAPRILGNFAGSTEQVLRWGACKWGFDEDITKARAVTESSWRMSTVGDRTDSAEACGLLGLEAPCGQSYGLLQVKGSVHLGTYPTSATSSSFGVDYAMAWLRACFEGSFTWLNDAGYQAGDEWGCVGAWFSGSWYDESAERYIEEVRGHLEARTWQGYLG